MTFTNSFRRLKPSFSRTAPRLVITMLMLVVLPHNAETDQTPSISIIGQQPGITPFINILTLSITDVNTLDAVQFTVAPVPGSITRPVCATYSANYLASRGYVNSKTGQITLPIFGLYANYANNVGLNYSFTDGSSQQDSVTIVTNDYIDQCGFKNPIVLQARTQDSSLSYDYILVKSSCGQNSPTIIDTDGAIRWVGTSSGGAFEFFDNAIYHAGTGLDRLELDGTD